MHKNSQLSELEQGLYENMIKSISETKTSKKIGIAFSGGVDSTLLAKIVHDLGYESLLLTIGFKNSHDVNFSKEISKLLKMEHDILLIEEKTFSQITKKIHDKIKTDNLSWNENCIAFYYIAKLAQKHGIQSVLTANGIDELFCGYNAYRDAISKGEIAINQMMTEKLENETQMMRAVNSVTLEFDVRISQPFLTDKFIQFARKIPINEKIKNSDDLVRKHIVRKVALGMGVPQESALQRKKAMQYGSSIHKNLMKTRKT